MSQRDITPTLDLVRGLASDDWDVKGAISELVDNSFGEARGDASRIDITWDRSTRELTVLDNGAGMKDVADLFQLGLGVGRHPKDIGKYGMGGTMALIWLGWGEPVQVWTKRKSYMASIVVPWSEMKDWRVPDQHWQVATLVNTPPSLLAERHGTLIRLSVPGGKRLHADTVQRELARRYAPGLRAGRQIRWTTIARGEERTEDLTAPDSLANPIFIDLTLLWEDKYLPLQGVIGRDPRIGVDRSQVEIGFGPRIVTTTKDCYSAPDDGPSYGGLGVAGYIDLGEGWQDYLTTAKTEITDARLWDALMGELFKRLEPLLREAETDVETVILNGIALKLEAHLGSAFEIDVAAPTMVGGGHQGGRGRGPGDGPTPTPKPSDEEGRGAKSPASTRVSLRFVAGRELDGLLYDVRLPNEDIEVWLNKDTAIVQEAKRRSSPAQEMLLEGIIAPAVASKLLDEPRILKQALTRVPHLRDRIEGTDKRSEKQAHLTTHLLTTRNKSAA